MKIAEVIATFPPSHGGMGYVCFHNALQLARRGHEVTVFTLDHGITGPEPDPPEFTVVRLRAPLLLGDGGIVPQLYPLLRGFDLIHLHYPFFGGAEYVYLASLLRSQPYFLTYHMDVPGNTALKKFLIGTYRRLFLKRILGRAARTGALARAHLESSEAAPFVDRDRIVDMPNGVDTDLFRPREQNAELIARHGLAGRTVVLFVGNLQPFKGLHVLIDAIAMTSDPGIVLLIVGGGYAEAVYRKQVQARGLEKRVIFAGPQKPAGLLPAYYNLSDFLVLPSTYSESFGLVVLEAMASGKPVIVSSLPGPASLVTPGKDGLIATVGDAVDLRKRIEELAGNPSLRRQMGTAARKKALEQYSWETIGDRLERTFQEMLRK